jgi:hypothetical protein
MFIVLTSTFNNDAVVLNTDHIIGVVRDGERTEVTVTGHDAPLPVVQSIEQIAALVGVRYYEGDVKPEFHEFCKLLNETRPYP